MKWHAAAKGTAIALALSLLAGGCAAQIEEVDPGVLAEVRKIGEVVWEQRQEGLWGTETVVNYAFMVNVGGDTEEESLNKAVASLHARNWTTFTDGRPIAFWLKSPQWKGVTLALNTLSTTAEHDLSEAKKAIERQGVKPEALVSVSAYVGW